MQLRTHNADRAALIALAAIALGWFFMPALVVNFGLWQNGIRFYQLWAVIADPAHELSGVNRTHALMSLLFAVICLASLLAPLAHAGYRRPALRWSYLLPFIVMAVTGAVLYAQGSMRGDVGEASRRSPSAFVAHIAQLAVGKASDAVATRISAGAGAYLALLGSCFLLLRGLMQYRVTAPVARRPKQL